MEDHKNKQIVTSVVVLVAVALIVGGIVLFGKKQSTQSTTSDTVASGTTAGVSTATPVTQPTTNSSSTSSGASTSTASSTYKDGSYSTTADYYTPEDTDSIAVKLTVSGGVVTDVSATTSTSSRESRQYDSAFLSSYKSYVVGKSLSSLNLNRVSGASLTTEGFNTALDTIRQQAQA